MAASRKKKRSAKKPRASRSKKTLPKKVKVRPRAPARKPPARKRKTAAAQRRSEAAKRGAVTRQRRHDEATERAAIVHEQRSRASRAGWKKRRARLAMAPLLRPVRRLSEAARAGLDVRERLDDAYARWSDARDAAQRAFDSADFREILEWVADEAGYDDAADFADQYVED